MPDNLGAVKRLANFIRMPGQKPNDIESQFRMLAYLLMQCATKLFCPENQYMAQVITASADEPQSFSKHKVGNDQSCATHGPEIDKEETGHVKYLEKSDCDQQDERGQRGRRENITDFDKTAANTPWSIQPHPLKNYPPDKGHED
jgi:hypothetical protein